MSTLRVNSILNSAGTGPTSTIQSGTAQNTTAGTAIDFTGIPSGVKRITVMFNGVSTSGTSQMQVQIGSGSVQATGYAGYAAVLTNAVAIGGNAVTTGFHIFNQVAAGTRSGHMVLTLVSGNIWAASHVLGDQNGPGALVGGGTVTLSGTLDRLRLTTVNGTDTFDAGSVNILYES